MATFLVVSLLPQRGRGRRQRQPQHHLQTLHTGALCLILLTLTLATATLQHPSPAADVPPADDADTVVATGWFVSGVIRIIAWVQGAGWLGVLGYTLFFATGVTLSLPCTPLEMLPGFLFGFRVGLPVAMLGKNLGNLVQVLLARHYLKAWAQRNFLAKYRSFRVVERMVSHKSILPLMLFRAIYLPLNVKNFGLGAMAAIPVRRILAACLLTGFPFAVVWTFLGTKAKGVIEILNGETPSLDVPPWMNWALPVVGLPLLLLLGWYIRRAWRAAEQEVAEAEAKATK